MTNKTRKRGPWHLCWHEQSKRWKKTVKGKTYYWKDKMQALADLAAIYADARCKDGDENVEFTMPLFLEDSCLYIKLVCIYADFCGYSDTLHYEPMTYEEYIANCGDGDDITEEEWRDDEKERREYIEEKQATFAWEVGALARIASGNFHYDHWLFLQDVWDALGCYGWRDEELEDLYQKLHKAWSKGHKKEEEETKAVYEALDCVEKEQLA